MPTATQDTIQRHWALLRHIPLYPNQITVTELKNKLKPDYHTTTRTIQRDLITLEQVFPLRCDTKGKTNYWSVMQGKQIKVTGMNTPTAMAFHMAQEHLHTLLPTSILDDLNSYFIEADHVIKKAANKSIRQWSNKIMVLNRGPHLKPPAIDPVIQATVYEALLSEHKIRAHYQKRGAKRAKEYTITPLGIFVRNGLVYLACKTDKYDGFHWLLHRFTNAEILDIPADIPDDFDFPTYVKAQHGYAYPVQPETIKLQAIFDNYAAEHLRECPLSADQTIKPYDEHNVLLSATVDNTQELRWWLQGYGAGVEVLKPKKLRQEFAHTAQTLYQHYHDKT
jgi:predicted DNA-binding transcriptional regulator YafY